MEPRTYRTGDRLSAVKSSIAAIWFIEPCVITGIKIIHHDRVFIGFEIGIRVRLR